MIKPFRVPQDCHSRGSGANGPGIFYGVKGIPICASCYERYMRVLQPGARACPARTSAFCSLYPMAYSAYIHTLDAVVQMVDAQTFNPVPVVMTGSPETQVRIRFFVEQGKQYFIEVRDGVREQSGDKYIWTKDESEYVRKHSWFWDSGRGLPPYFFVRDPHQGSEVVFAAEVMWIENDFFLPRIVERELCQCLADIRGSMSNPRDIDWSEILRETRKIREMLWMK